MTNTKELKIAMIRAEVTNEECAECLGISKVAFWMKATNQTEFKSSEIVKLVEFLKLDNADIFLQTDVTDSHTDREENE